MFDFQTTLQDFLDSVFGFVGGMMDLIFGSLADFFSGLNLPLL